jgi:uncharacterized protein YkwD
MRNFPSLSFPPLAVAVVLSVCLVAPPVGATTDTERAVQGLVNGARIEAGLRPLPLSDRLSRIARRHSRQMAVQRTLFHSCLPCVIGGDWRKLSENVGFGPDYEGVHQRLMDSRPHRSNILGRGYRRVGVGVVRRGGLVWVTEIFFG